MPQCLVWSEKMRRYRKVWFQDPVLEIAIAKVRSFVRHFPVKCIVWMGHEFCKYCPKLYKD